MSQQSDEALKSGADGTKAIGKSAGKAGAKLGAKAAKKGAKKVASEAAQAAAAPEAYLAKVYHTRHYRPRYHYLCNCLRDNRTRDE